MERIGARYSRDVNVALFFNRSAHLVGQLARHLDGIDALDVIVQALPLGDPGLGGVGERDKALVDLAGAVVDGVRVAFQVEELFAVGAALLSETLYGGGGWLVSSWPATRTVCGWDGITSRGQGRDGVRRTVIVITMEQTIHARR